MRKSIIPLLALVLTFVSCSESSTDAPVVEPAGSAHYYINNQSSADLNVVFTKSPELGSGLDSATVSGSSNQKIFEDGIIGVNPKPSNSFSKIEFYTSINEDTPAFTIDPIDNEAWEVISKDWGDMGYGLTKYEFTITDNDLN